MASESSGPSPSESELEAAFDDLEMPDMTPKGLISHFGPGIILMMTGDRGQGLTDLVLGTAAINRSARM